MHSYDATKFQFFILYFIKYKVKKLSLGIHTYTGLNIHQIMSVMFMITLTWHVLWIFQNKSLKIIITFLFPTNYISINAVVLKGFFN